MNQPILTGKASSLPGFNSVALDVGKLLDALRACEARGVAYGLGSKAPEHTSGPYAFDYPPTFNAIDCSGWVRWALYHATGGSLLIPDGSANQNDWAGAQGLKHYGPDAARSAYLSNGGNKDHALRHCFCRASASETIGHVWMLWSGFTMESSGGVGPHSRPFDTPVLSRIVTDIYVLGHYPTPA